MDDPWDWDVGRVVQEFCTSKRSWKAHKEPPTLPPLDQIANAFREQEVDGFTLLTYPDQADLSRELGAKKLNQKATLSYAIEQLRKRSPKYQRHQSGQEDVSENESIPKAQAQPMVPSGSLVKKRLLADLKSLDNGDGRTEAVESLSQEKNASSISQPMPTPVLETTAEPSGAPEPIKKKRRIAPTMVSADVDVNAIRNIPTAADEVSGIPSNSGQQSMPVVDPSKAYLGMDGMTRIDVIELDEPITDEPLSQESQTLNLFHSCRLPRGRQLQIHRLFKRRLLPKKTPNRLIPTKPDTVFGANDPNYDEVLPLYGQSDSEEGYDFDTWEEMEAEFGDLAADDPARAGLSSEQVNLIIDEEIDKLVANWKTHRLPKLSRTAYRVWSQPRKRGYLRMAIGSERQLVQTLEARITKYREEILEQHFYNEASIRSQCLIFEQTVEERETASWKIDILLSKDEPQKPTFTPRTSTRKPRKPQRMDDDGTEILTSESEGDMGDFIVDDDEVSLAGDAPGSPMDISDYDSPRPGSPVNGEGRDLTSNGGRSNPLDNIEPASTSDQTQATKERGQSVHGPCTPSKSQRTQPTIIDLTVTPEKAPMTNSDVPKGSSIRGIRIVKKPDAEGKMSKLKGLSSLIMGIEDLSATEQAVATELSDLGPTLLSTIFSKTTTWVLNKIWNNYILPAMEVAEVPKFPYEEGEMDVIVALRLTRFFHIWLGRKAPSWPHYKRLSEDDKNEIIEYGDNGGREEFKVFIKFINRIADRFEWTYIPEAKKQGNGSISGATQHQAANKAVAESDDYEAAGSDTSGGIDASPASKKRRRPILHDRSAAALRTKNQEQIRQQEKQRKKLRATLEASGAGGHSQAAMIINESKEDNQSIIYIHEEIASRIKEHQVEGVRFMWDQVVAAKSGTRQGCLLAHTMGLGKTMQIITLLVAIAQAANSDDETVSSQIPDELRESKTLIICPPGLVNNWLEELLFWTPEDHQIGRLRKIDSQTPAHERVPVIDSWAEEGGVLVMGYPLLKQLMKIETAKHTLINTPNIVVADEAHNMKNPKSETHLATSGFRTPTRIALTGSPLSNNVEEYHSMINWVAPNFLSDLSEFRQDYANPIRDGLSVQSTSTQRRTALARLHALKLTVGPKVHRRTIATLKNDIPPKTEFVLTVPLTGIQKVAYENYIRFQQSMVTENTNSVIFASLSILNLLCTHPNCFLKYLEQNKDKRKGDEGYISLPPNLVSDQIALLRKTKDIESLFHSWKIPILTKILDECKAIGDSILIFSQSIETLNYLETVLRGQKRAVMRLDGSTAINNRQHMVKQFNSKVADVFLISTTAGGLGLNITGANRVIIFDFKFNPQQEQQAVGRAWRIGQSKPVFVYRLVCGGTFEDKLLNRSVFKIQLADRVVDKKNPIPKASQFEDLCNMPEETPQKDIVQHRGLDPIVDRILDSETLRVGLRSIVLMDTFQEESIEETKLSKDVEKEALDLVRETAARRAGKPLGTIPPSTQEYNLGGTFPPQHNAAEGSAAGSSLPAVIVPSIIRPSPGNNGGVLSPQPATPTLAVEQVSEGHTDQPNLGQHLQPTMGASTGIRDADEVAETSQADYDGEHGHNEDPQHLDSALRKLSSNAQRSSGPSEKSHRFEDANTLKLVMARRQSNKTSTAKSSSPRLPHWAREAVKNQGKQSRIAPPSSDLALPKSTSTPRPLPRSPFT